MPTLVKYFVALAIFLLCRPIVAEEKIQHWLRANAALHDEGSPLFYVNQEDKGQILIILGEQVYLLEAKYPSVVRVINALPKANGDFTVDGIKTEPLKDMTAIIQHIPGTPKFAGGTYWLGWLVCFQDNGKLDSYPQSASVRKPKRQAPRLTTSFSYWLKPTKSAGRLGTARRSESCLGTTPVKVSLKRQSLRDS